MHLPSVRTLFPRRKKINAEDRLPSLFVSGILAPLTLHVPSFLLHVQKRYRAGRLNHCVAYQATLYKSEDGAEHAALRIDFCDERHPNVPLGSVLVERTVAAHLNAIKNQDAVSTNESFDAGSSPSVTLSLPTPGSSTAPSAGGSLPTEDRATVFTSYDTIPTPLSPTVSYPISRVYRFKTPISLLSFAAAAVFVHNLHEDDSLLDYERYWYAQTIFTLLLLLDQQQPVFELTRKTSARTTEGLPPLEIISSTAGKFNHFSIISRKSLAEDVRKRLPDFERYLREDVEPNTQDNAGLQAQAADLQTRLHDQDAGFRAQIADKDRIIHDLKVRLREVEGHPEL